MIVRSKVGGITKLGSRVLDSRRDLKTTVVLHIAEEKGKKNCKSQNIFLWGDQITTHTHTRELFLSFSLFRHTHTHTHTFHSQSRSIFGIDLGCVLLSCSFCSVNLNFPSVLYYIAFLEFVIDKIGFLNISLL